MSFIVPDHDENNTASTPVDVAQQDHYAFGIEPIEYMKSRFLEEEYRGYLTGNIIKYISRYTKKNGLEDLKKAQVYLNWLIQFYEEGNK